MTPHPPVVRVRRGAAAELPGREELRALRAEFEKSHAIRLPGLLDADLVESVSKRLDGTTFLPAERQGVYCGARTDDDALHSTLLFLLNESRLFDAISFLLGGTSVRSFAGRFYRWDPRQGHRLDWHADHEDQRVAGLTINLNRRPYEGGVLQVRRDGADGLLAELPNPVPGDALLVRIAPGLLHRNTPVTGANPKTVFIGWFRSAAFPPEALRF